MRAIDRRAGAAIAILAIAVLWSARAFPNVPGQKLGASTLPMIVAAALLACGVLLILRSLRAGGYTDAAADPGAAPTEAIAPAFGILAAIALYVVASDALGYLIVAPACLLIAMRTLRVRWAPAIGWSIVAALAVHVSFYKLLKVPLPWGLLQPLY